MKVKNGKMVKYLIISLLSLLLGLNNNVVSAHQYTNYFGIEMTNNEYFTLLNLGFTDEEIYLMDKDTFYENKDLDATLVAQSNKYYKIVRPMYGASYVVEVTQNEYLNQTGTSPMGSVTTEYIQEISSISANGNKYRYKDTVSWLSLPPNKDLDVMAIGFINSVYISSLIYNKYSYMDSSGVWHNSSLYYDKKNTSTGGSFVYKIPDELYGLSSMIYFDVSKNTTDTLTSLTICGDYAHALGSVTQSQAANHGINSGGIQFDPSVYNLFDAIPCASTTVSVSW